MIPATRVAHLLRDVPTDAIKQDAARGCLTALACFANSDGTNTRPSQSTVAAVAGCSDRDVRRKLADLERSGLIVRTTAPAGRPVVYRIDFERLEALADATPDKPRTDPGRTPDTVSAYQDQEQYHTTKAVKGR